VSDCGAHVETSEGLHYATALVVHSRTRFIVNLLPLLQKATALRRVVSVFAGTKEGPVSTTDFQGWKVPLMSRRGHASSLVTLSLEALAKKAPDVSFIHNFPGPVRSGIARGTEGALMFIVKVAFKILGPMVYIPTVEVGERHVFLATSAKYPAGTSGDAASGVPLAGGVTAARGTNSKAEDLHLDLWTGHDGRKRKTASAIALRQSLFHAPQTVALVGQSMNFVP
jgi:hypothetical protein